MNVLIKGKNENYIKSFLTIESEKIQFLYQILD